jgi:hypothetical protein
MENSNLGYSEFIRRLTALILDYEKASGDDIRGVSIKRAVLKGGKRVFKISSLYYGEQQSTV